MLTKEENQLITRTGPGTPMGNVIRAYWIPAAMSAELPSADCAPIRMRLLGENLIAFRTTSGEVGVVADACPHRGASLFFGRNEEEGLRCVYHGWKFDTAGNCLDMPSEPPESNFKAKVKAHAYPAQERSGMIWLYMGPRKVPPPLPEIVANMQPEDHYHIGAYSSECNWLQSLEGDYDTIHVSFLHRGTTRFEDARMPDPAFDRYALKTRWARHFIKETEFGITSGNNRPAEEGTTYWRMAQYLYPFYAIPPASYTSLGMIAVVPIDDENCLRFHWSVKEPGARGRFGGPGLAEVDGVTTSYHSDPSHNTSDWLGRFKLAGTARNDYYIDRAVQKEGRPDPTGIAYSGIPGRGQDGAMTESMGTVYQRDQEHLGVTDSGIIRMRRVMIRLAKAMRDEGKEPPAVDRPELYRVTSACAILPDGVSGFEATLADQWKMLEVGYAKIEVRAR